MGRKVQVVTEITTKAALQAYLDRYSHDELTVATEEVDGWAVILFRPAGGKQNACVNIRRVLDWATEKQTA